MGRYQFYCNKIEKDDKQTLDVFFCFKIRFCGLIDDEGWDVGGLDRVTIGLRIGKLVDLKIKHFLSKGEI